MKICILILISLLFSVTSSADASSSTLTVKSDPEGAEVWLNDKYIGDSPILNKEVKPGKYKIKLIDPIHRISASDNIYVNKGASLLYEKELQKKFGSLKISTEPEGANVFLSTPLGKTPLKQEFMIPGKYRLTIKHPKEKYITEYEKITVEKDKSVDISKKLEKIKIFDKKALIRIGLGAGAAASLIWAIYENGEAQKFYYDGSTDKWASSKSKRTIGIILGCACIAGFEIIAFF